MSNIFASYLDILLSIGMEIHALIMTYMYVTVLISIFTYLISNQNHLHREYALSNLIIAFNGYKFLNIYIFIL